MSSATTSERSAPAAWARLIRRWNASSVRPRASLTSGRSSACGRHWWKAVLGVQRGALPDDVRERGPGILALDGGVDLCRQPAEALGHDCAEHVVLVGEGAVHGPDPDACALSQLGHRRVQAPLGEELARCGQDAGAVSLGVSAARA
jgi:hypothetical protein